MRFGHLQHRRNERFQHGCNVSGLYDDCMMIVFKHIDNNRENKGLNVFNSAYVLANPKTATDADYERILGVIGHEYFHNWTGNRVTVRDWFQLTLKEGLTVFRDQVRMTFSFSFPFPFCLL